MDMDINTADPNSEEAMEQLLAKLGSGEKKSAKKNLWLDVEEKEQFAAYQKLFDDEMMFKEYDTLGNTVVEGIVKYKEGEGRIEYQISKYQDGEVLHSGWFALGLEDKSVVVYSTAGLTGGGERSRFGHVVAAYFHLKEALVEEIENRDFESVGVGLSGEEEVKISLGIKEKGHLK